MRVIGEQTIKCADIVLRPEYERSARHPMVASIAESMAARGQIQPVGIEKGSNELCWGNKRFAANRLNKQAYIRAQIVVFDYPEEKLVVIEAENLERSELTNTERVASRARIAALEEQRLAREAEEASAPPVPTLELDRDIWADDEEVQPPPPPKKPLPRGRPKTIAAEARREAAKKLGVSTSTIRRSQETAGAGDATPRKAKKGKARSEFFGLALALKKAIHLAKEHSFNAAPLEEFLARVEASER